ncbi:unnamed protein product, partial [Urochloa humidicola]
RILGSLSSTGFDSFPPPPDPPDGALAASEPAPSRSRDPLHMTQISSVNQHYKKIFSLKAPAIVLVHCRSSKYLAGESNLAVYLFYFFIFFIQVCLRKSKFASKKYNTTIATLTPLLRCSSGQPPRFEVFQETLQLPLVGG